MSTVATEFNVKTFLATFVRKMGSVYANDFNHISAEHQIASPMGVARPASIFTAECASFNRFMVKLLKGETVEMPDEEGRKAYYASFDTGEKALEVLNASVAELATAIEEASDEQIASTAQMPWGEPMPMAEAIHMAATHMAYHDGQLNYIQSLHGDAASHWH